NKRICGSALATNRDGITTERSPSGARQVAVPLDCRFGCFASTRTYHPVDAVRASLSRSRSCSSALQRFAQLIDAAEEDCLPGVPREQAEDESATRAHDLHGNQHERVEERFEFHTEHSVLLGSIAGRPPARLGQPQREPRL